MNEFNLSFIKLSYLNSYFALTLGYLDPSLNTLAMQKKNKVIQDLGGGGVGRGANITRWIYRDVQTANWSELIDFHACT